MEKLKLSPPSITYANELVMLFGEDPDIKIEYKDEEKEVCLYVDNTDKADALTQLLPTEKDFGGEVLHVNVIPADKKEEPTDAELIKKAFKGNPAVAEIADRELFEHPVTYVAFAKKVIQYYNDDLSDLYRNRTTLLQEIAKDVFEKHENVYFCTNNK